MNFITKHILEITVLCYLFLFVCWTIGYFANGLFGTKFEISSALQGIITLFGAGVFSSIKYLADSWKNSEQGVNPYQSLVEATRAVLEKKEVHKNEDSY